VAGGNKVALFNGGFHPPGIPQGTDGITLAPRQPQVWKRGAIEEVAWAMTANHGGGYAYRLCKVSLTDPVTEECFQRNPLNFASKTSQWLQYGEFVPTQPRYEIPITVVSTGTYPAGSQWARMPIPACKICDQGLECGAEVPPNMTDASGKGPAGDDFFGGDKWIEQVDCASVCGGATPANVPPPPINNKTGDYGLSDGALCPPGVTQFQEVVPGLSGFLANHTYPERSIIAFSIVDQIVVPDLEDGTYMLSWRWDCEQTYQIWQNCADIEIKGEVERPAPEAPPDAWRVYFVVAVTGFGFLSLIAVAIACVRYRKLKDTPLLHEPLRKKSVQA